MNQLTSEDINNLTDHQKDLVLHFLIGCSWGNQEIEKILRDAIKSAKQWMES